MGSNDNLVHYKPGQSGNPLGSPYSYEIRSLMLSASAETKRALFKFLIATEEFEDSSNIGQIIKAIGAKAKKGDVFAFNALMDRAFGKPKESKTIELLEDSEKPQMTDEEKQRLLRIIIGSGILNTQDTIDLKPEEK